MARVVTSAAKTDSTNGSPATVPVARQATRSPSTAVAAGEAARATPAEAARATSDAWVLSRRASVIRQTTVVACPGVGGSIRAVASRSIVGRQAPSDHTPAMIDPSAAIPSPNGLTTAIALSSAAPTRLLAAPSPVLVQDYSLDAFVGDLRRSSPWWRITALLGEGEHPGLASGLVLVDVVGALRPRASRIRDFMTANSDGLASLQEVADAIAAYNPLRRRPRNLQGLRKNVRLRDDGRWYWH